MSDSFQELYAILDAQSETPVRDSDERNTAALIVSSISNELEDDWSTTRDFFTDFHSQLTCDSISNNLVDSSAATGFEEIQRYADESLPYMLLNNENEPNPVQSTENESNQTNALQTQMEVNSPIKLKISRNKTKASERKRLWKTSIVEKQPSHGSDDEKREVSKIRNCAEKVPAYLTAFRMSCKEYPFVYCCNHCGHIYTALRAAQLHQCIRKRRGRKAISHAEMNT